MKITTLLPLAGILCLVSETKADTVDFSYNIDNEPYKVWGTSRKETYDIAIHINTPAMVGNKVMEIYVPVHGSPELFNNTSGWLSTDLSLSGSQNTPDISAVEARFEPLGQTGDYLLKAVFPVPYTITEEGVYVGYSLEVNSLTMASKSPIAVVGGASQGSLWIHTSKTSEYASWTDASRGLGMMSAMTVVMEGNVNEYAALISLDETIYSVANTVTPVSFSLSNLGIRPIMEIGVACRIGDSCQNHNIELDTPLAPGDTAELEIPLNGCGETGNFTFEMAITSIDGVQQPMVWVKSKLKSLNFIPVNRPIVEEFTGLNCQYCPEGYVVMEEMNRDYGDLFIPLSYHVSSYEKGAMVTTTEIPVENVQFYPSVAINRGEPYSPRDLKSDWLRRRKEFVPMDIAIDAWYTDESRSSIEAMAKVTFAEMPQSSEYKVAFCLVADGLCNNTWVQANYYSGMQDLTGEYWDIFTEGGKNIRGLTYNFVVASFPDMQGAESSLISNITVDHAYESSYSFDMAKVRNVRNEEFINPEARLRVVGIVIDNVTGKPVNSNSSVYVDLYSGGINPFSTTSEPAQVVYYDMSGMPLRAPVSGPCIRQEVYKDGTIKVRKIIVK